MRNIVGTLLDHAGAPLAGVRIRFIPVDANGKCALVWDAVSSGHEALAPVEVSALTDSAGAFTVSLWETDRGNVANQYLCRVDVSGAGRFYGQVPTGAGALSWAEFMAQGVPLTPQEITSLNLHTGNALIHVPDPVAASAGNGWVPSFNATTQTITWVQQSGGGGGGGTWGSITGTLSAQTDLQNALNAKAASGHNHSGIYDPAGSAAAAQAAAIAAASSDATTKANAAAAASTPVAHATSTNNPHSVTAAQAGAYTTNQVDAALSTKADLVGGLVPANQLPGMYTDNLLPNSSARIHQRADAGIVTNLSTARQIGGTDCVAMWASAGAVSAGTIGHAETSVAGATGDAARAAAVTLTGAASLAFALRMEAQDARTYKNKTASFQIAVAHDVGSNVDYTVTVKKADAADNWSTMTTIATSSAMPVATATVLKFEGIAMGDCAHGIEIMVVAACGAVSGKNFDATDWALAIGAACAEFGANTYARDYAHCQRYLPGWIATGSGLDALGQGLYTSTTSGFATVALKAAPRKQPTGIQCSAASNFIASSGTPLTAQSVVFAYCGNAALIITLTVSGATAQIPQQTRFNSVGAYLLATGAELF